MKQNVLITNSKSIWKEDFDVSSKELAKKEILEIVKMFNINLKVGEEKRKLHSMPITNKKVIYFADPIDPPADQVEAIIINPLIKKGIFFDKIECTDTPPFKDIYDILFFDWGGMSIGNSLLEHFCKYIIDFAKDYPSRYYIMTSTFTEAAMKDAIDYLGSNIKIPNIFLTIDSFAEYWNSLTKP